MFLSDKDEDIVLLLTGTNEVVSSNFLRSGLSIQSMSVISELRGLILYVKKKLRRMLATFIWAQSLCLL